MSERYPVRHNITISKEPHLDGRVQLAVWVDSYGISGMTTAYLNRDELVRLMELADAAIDAIDHADRNQLTLL